MAEPRNVVTAVSIVVAVLCAGWAIYATRHADTGGAPPATAMAQRAGTGGPGSSGPGRPGGGAGAGAPVTVVTAPARMEQVTRELKALGTAVANESIEVTSKTSLIVTSVQFRDGQTVRKGQTLVELDSAQARADLAIAEAALAESTSVFTRSRELMSTQILSQSQFEQLEAKMKADRARVDSAQARLADTIIRAPFSGRVGLRRVSVGGLVDPGTVITTLDDTSVIKLDFSVPENLLGGLRPGLALTARSTTFPDREFAGKVTSIDSRVDPTTRSVTVRAALPNPGNLLKPGMFLNVTLAREQSEVLVVAEQALVPEQSRQYVFVVSDGQVAKREVRIGRREPGNVEITAGLEAGERVIVEGTQKVRDGSTVRELQPEAAMGADAPRNGAAPAATGRRATP